MANSLLTAGASNDASATSASESAKDTRVFMYRQGEARMFNSPEEVPPGEGWVDHPDKVAPAPEQKRKQRKEGGE